MRTLMAIAATSIASLVLAGCGGEATTTKDTGASTKDSPAKLFVDACGSCHALRDAGTQGSVGPPLDDTALDADAIARQIEIGAQAMPPNLLQGDDKTAVARYVAEQAKLGKTR